MHFGPQRMAGEPVSAFRYRQARYCWPWAWATAPVLMVSIYALKTGLDGPLWASMVFVMLLAGTTLGMAAVGGLGLSLGAGWARLCESSASVALGWERTRYLLSSIILVALWLWAFYWTFVAITQQHIVAGKPATIVRLVDNPARFFLSLTVHASLLVSIPTYLMSEAGKTFARRRRSIATRPRADAIGFEPERRSLPEPEPRRMSHQRDIEP
ncbi:hypothetical protein [Dyella japonica]|uniref:Uncharacterized protein n=1 Tax=Dyella japonica TaxID=231455 RepID=A0ABV2K2H4_9GAMM